MSATCTITQTALQVGSPNSHHKLLPKKNGYHHSNGYLGQSFPRQTSQLCKELIYTLLVEVHGVRLNGHTNGVVPPDFKDQELKYAYQSLLAACHQFLKQHLPELQNRVNSLDISDSFLYTSYHQVLNKMFEDQVVNWGRVIAMLCFTEELAFRVHTELMSPKAIDSLVGWQVTFIIEYLQGWMIDQQGWCGLPDKFHPDKQHEAAAKEEDSLGLGSLFTIAVVGLGATALALLSR